MSDKKKTKRPTGKDPLAKVKDVAHKVADKMIEAKAAGAPLIFELRRMGVMVSDYTPTRGNDKFVRINSVTDLFRSGRVWAPETKWADEVIEEMARFPVAVTRSLRSVSLPDSPP